MPYSDRLSRVHKQLGYCTAFLFEDPLDILYLTGANVSRGSVWVDRTRALLIVDSRYIEACSALPHIEVALEHKRIWDKLQQTKGRVGVDGRTMTMRRMETLKFKWVDAKWIADMRAIKTPNEVIALQLSADILWKSYRRAIKLIKEGVTEREIKGHFHKIALDLGADDLSFEPIIAFGENAALPHHHSSERRLKRGDCVLFDAGVIKDGYCSDMTRTTFFGRPSREMAKIHKIVVAAHDAAVAKCRVGVQTSVVDRAARDVIEEAGYGDKFIHSLGHGIGLQVHETPAISHRKGASVKLEKGMVFTIEPGIYLPGIGGVRHENMVLLTQKGPKLFFHDKT